MSRRRERHSRASWRRCRAATSGWQPRLLHAGRRTKRPPHGVLRSHVRHQRCHRDAIHGRTCRGQLARRRRGDLGSRWVITPLNAAGRQAALAAGWRYVGGIRDRFLTHGYCANEGWVVQVGQSLGEQHDENGAFHPNRAGQRVYGSALFADLQTSLVIPAPPTSPGPTGGPTALGDLMVITTTPDVVTSVGVKMTGGVPIAGAVRRLDRLTLGDGLLFPAGPRPSTAPPRWRSGRSLLARATSRCRRWPRKLRCGQRGGPQGHDRAGACGWKEARRRSPERRAGDHRRDDQRSRSARRDDHCHRQRQRRRHRDLVPATTEQITFKHGRNVVLLPVGSTSRRSRARP